ncbi:MAG: hypothetical protein AT717_06315 [Vulcanisaeta sp. CIS_19]|nr:MAG: hypothetical protein AT717_06315 [Vulcanisaeta sp. CIS_19]
MGKEAIREEGRVKTSIVSNLLIRLVITKENEYMHVMVVGPPGFEPGITRALVTVGFTFVAHGGSPSRAS